MQAPPQAGTFADLEQGGLVQLLASFITAKEIALQAIASKRAWSVRTRDRELLSHHIALNDLEDGQWEHHRVHIPTCRSLVLNGSILDVATAMDYFTAMAKEGWLRLERADVNAFAWDADPDPEGSVDRFKTSLCPFVEALANSISLRELELHYDIELDRPAEEALVAALGQSRSLLRISSQPLHDLLLERLPRSGWTNDHRFLVRARAPGCSVKMRDLLTGIRGKVSGAMQNLDLLASNVRSEEDEGRLHDLLLLVSNGIETLGLGVRGEAGGEVSELDEFVAEVTLSLWRCGWSAAKHLRESYGLGSGR